MNLEFAVRLFLIFLSTAAALISPPAFAYDAFYTGKVTAIEATYIPGRVVFSLDTGVSGCPAGSFLGWAAKGDTEAAKIANAQGVLSTLLTAKVAGQTIRVYVSTGDCSVDFIHMF